MDPNANLAEQSTLLTKLSTDSDQPSNYDRRRLSELRRALAGWLAGGGFEPTWPDYPAATKEYRAWVKRAAKFQDLWR